MSIRTTATILTSIITVTLSPALSNDPGQKSARRFIKSDWQTVLVIGGGARDTTLLYPLQMAADSSGLYVFDHGRNALLKFDDAGHLLWSQGREGSGPGEYKRVRDIAIGFGTILVVDAANTRIARIDKQSGRHLGYISLANVGLGEWVQVLDTTRTLVVTGGHETSAFIIDNYGAVQKEFSLPLPDYRDTDWLLRQIVMAKMDAPSASWTAGYMMSSAWVNVPSGKQPYISHFVESQSDGKVEQRRSGSTQTTMVKNATRGVQTLSRDGNTLIALFAGSTKDKLRILDYYDLRSGKYIHSRLLPFAASNFVVMGNRLCMAALTDDGPTIRCVRKLQ